MQLLRGDSSPIVLRYHPLLVALHWVIAALLIAALSLGALKLAPLANTDPMKYEALRAHMAGGLVLLMLMLLRLATRRLTLGPAAAATGSAALDRLAFISHRAFYALIIAMPVTGLILAIQSGSISILAGAHPALPTTFWEWPVRSAHWMISRALMALIALHLAGVLFHTFVRRDRLLRRMGFGKRLQATSDTEVPRVPALQRISFWLTRIVLMLGTVLFTMIGAKFVLDPVGAVRDAGIVLTTPMALTTVRASFGAFPLACALVILTCLVAVRRQRTGLWFMGVLIGVVLAVRFFGIHADGTLHENERVLTAEAVLFILTVGSLLTGSVGTSAATRTDQ